MLPLYDVQIPQLPKQAVVLTVPQIPEQVTLWMKKSLWHESHTHMHTKAIHAESVVSKQSSQAKKSEEVTNGNRSYRLVRGGRGKVMKSNLWTTRS